MTNSEGFTMTGTFTAVIETDDEGGFWAWCPEVPGANGRSEAVPRHTEIKDLLARKNYRGLQIPVPDKPG